MHRPPPASLQLGRSPWHLGAIIGFAFFSGLTLAWQWPSLPGPVQGLISALWLASLLLACWQWSHSLVGELRWDGRTWTLSCVAADMEVRPELVMDGQRVLLLRLRPAPASALGRQLFWVFADASGVAPVAGAWSAVRRALVFAARPLPAKHADRSMQEAESP